MIAGGITSESAQDQFLQLLVTQLQNQDPLEPVNQQEFISELAQFSTLEGIEKLNANFSDMLKLQELTQGTSLLGHQVRFAGVDGGDEGIVQSVNVDGGRIVLDVDGIQVSINDVTGVAG